MIELNNPLFKCKLKVEYKVCVLIVSFIKGNETVAELYYNNANEYSLYILSDKYMDDLIYDIERIRELSKAFDYNPVEVERRLNISNIDFPKEFFSFKPRYEYMNTMIEVSKDVYTKKVKSKEEGKSIFKKLFGGE